MKLSKNALIGYPSGIITGVTYGLNPLFAIPLLGAGAAVESILFFRYSIAAVLLGLWIVASGGSLRVSSRQAGVLLGLGVFFSLSSLLLFQAYRYIPSGLATTLVFLYPVLVAVIMVFLGKIPSWPVWLSIFATFAGVVIMTGGGDGAPVDPSGIALSVGSALLYAFVLVIINRNKIIAPVSNSVLTFYCLLVGTAIFAGRCLWFHAPLLGGISGLGAWLNLLGLAILPTIVSTATLAVATRNIGATKASVLGVFEPITAIMVGTIAFGEPLTAPVVIGISIAVAAVTFMVLVTKR